MEEKKRHAKMDWTILIGKQLKTLDLDGEIQLSCYILFFVIKTTKLLYIYLFKPQKAFPLIIFYIKKLIRPFCRVIG